eukprot:CAMPEP_0117061414 /NCGR_PEP_ID=MMETSP0472-20121206/42739_1 /TAXON_ID=693140 ORGANISM="Tiarina fusus, Strain LIS" /NCGR_SAMPLE_ID=MMETSP0472 /ASSEMBLY_ACC=CAM_ASM_000603 /LENGTH=747 /DNA_ID=CAMNT_0004780049 /DNA_START=320 /DNA_END=2563 /DNA_ORIENTATION=+
MGDNPFDVFASELNAALPPGAAPAPPADDGNPFGNGFFAPPSQAPTPSDKPVMNAPPQMMGYGQQPMMNGQQSMMGQQPMMGGQQPMMGQQPPMMGQQPPMYGGMASMGDVSAMSSMGGMSGYGAPNGMGGPPPPQQPPQQPQNMGYGAPMNGMGGPPPPQQDNSFAGPPPGAPPPANDPFNSYGAPPPAGPPQGVPPSPSFEQQQITPYGGPPPTPPGQGPPPSNDPFAAYGAPPAGPPPSSDPFGGAPPGGAPPPANDPFGGYGAPPAAAPQAPPANDPFGGYGAPPQQPGAPPPSDPYGGAGAYGAPPPSQDPYAQPPQDPYAQPGAPGQYGAPYPGGDPNQGALVVSQQQNQPYAQLPPGHQPPPQQMPPQAADPFSVFNEAPAPPPGPPPPGPGAMVPAQAPPQQAPPPMPQGEGDLWGDLGFDPPTPAQQAPGPVQEETRVVASADAAKSSGELPPGGEYYDARIFTPTLGVMFFKPQELTDSLFLNTDKAIVDCLNERPVVAFIVEGSSARSAGVELGHVLLKVNGVDVKNPKEASRLIKEGPRPLPLLFYVPNTDVVVAEGEHMVKYDTRETTAPNSAKEWKPKYVVIGGIIAQPWMMNMYRSKSEYDIAVIETQARRPVSVKVKQFSLQGARIQNDWQGPQMVKYKNKLHPWKYIVVLPVARNPIKISSPNLASLKPVHEGIRRVLLAQQRERGGNHHSAAPVRNDQYARPQHHSDPYGGRAPPNNGYSQQQTYRNPY